MSDKELVELIRSAPWSDGFPYLKETADRIEELLLKNENLMELAVDEHTRAAALAHKLAKEERFLSEALEALDLIGYLRDDETYTADKKTARETYARLTRRIK